MGAVELRVGFDKVNTIFKDVFQALVAEDVCIHCPLTCSIESLGAVGFLELDHAHGALIIDLRVVAIGEDSLHQRFYVFTLFRG